jgi:hypothetical protein
MALEKALANLIWAIGLWMLSWRDLGLAGLTKLAEVSRMGAIYDVSQMKYHAGQVCTYLGFCKERQEAQFRDFDHRSIRTEFRTVAKKEEIRRACEIKN